MKLVMKGDTRVSMYVVFSSHVQMGAGTEMEDCSLKVWVLPGQLERNRGVEVEGICKAIVKMVDPGLS